MTNLSPKLTALMNKGLDLHKAGDLDGAVAAYDSVLKKKPQNVDALWLKGAAMIGKGRAADAVPLLERAVKRRPTDAAIVNDLGMAHEAAGEIGQAREAFERSIALDGNLPSALINVARFAIRDGDPSRALAMTEQALKAQPHSTEGHNTRALAFKALGKLDDALKAFAAALAIQPNNAGTLFNKGDTLRLLGERDGARIALERARQHSSAGSDDWIKATMTLGMVAAKSGEARAAHALYCDVLKYDAANLQTLTNRGELRQSQGDLEGAARDYDAALQIEPQLAPALYNRSRLELLQGNWVEGWRDFEARWGMDDFESAPRDHGLPVWGGSAASQSKVLLWGEQGLGDQIQFASQVSDLITSGVQPILEIDPRLVPLFRENFDCPVYAYDDVPADVLSDVDAQCALGSLGGHVRNTDDAFEPRKAFLHPKSELTAQLRAKYQDMAGGRPIIGIAWASMNPTYGDEKSLPLQHWTPLLQSCDAFYVSLQYGDVTSDVQQSPADVFVDDAVDQVADLCAAAAQIGAVDHVISISNTAVHIAGAQGKPVWVLVPAVPEWRWGLDRRESPWYADVTIYRQPSHGDWAGALDAVKADLATKFVR